MDVGLSEAQTKKVELAFEGLLAAVRETGDGDLQNGLRLVIRQGRIVEFRLICEVTPPPGLRSLDWLNALAIRVAQRTGYGTVEAIFHGNEVVGGRIEVSHDLASL